MSRYVTYVCVACGHSGPLDLGPEPSAPPAPALDVERLARVLQRDCVSDLHDQNCDPEDHWAQAERTAAEYAREGLQ